MLFLAGPSPTEGTAAFQPSNHTIMELLRLKGRQDHQVQPLTPHCQVKTMSLLSLNVTVSPNHLMQLVPQALPWVCRGSACPTLCLPSSACGFAAAWLSCKSHSLSENSTYQTHQTEHNQSDHNFQSNKEGTGCKSLLEKHIKIIPRRSQNENKENI